MLIYLYFTSNNWPITIIKLSVISILLIYSSLKYSNIHLLDDIIYQKNLLSHDNQQYFMCSHSILVNIIILMSIWFLELRSILRGRRSPIRKPTIIGEGWVIKRSSHEIVCHVVMYWNMELELVLVAIQYCLVLLHDFLGPNTRNYGYTHTHVISLLDVLKHYVPAVLKLVPNMYLGRSRTLHCH